MVAVLKTPAPKASMDEQNRFWLDVVEKYRSTRQGRVAFCKWLGIKPEDLAKWLRRLEPKLTGEKGGDVTQAHRKDTLELDHLLAKRFIVLRDDLVGFCKPVILDMKRSKHLKG